ncbi:MAG: beta-ketoacyl-ACP reductase [Candidatus Wallbacteria bacterium HGW-Wallbacteria-1]|uniref:Beta-ketoacyl-ACP reductase n=1 Tax=Candidatus Wallbacteria bacterium HGW-Wallbacteria-1 TaxID=2013854 RepID=A0A2N1PPQ1_9BACT|nr:MAG: beta-ketoacyl-ACP reductase [Candidatus Wallbacteria bacterium HGW-Wallbacteria-1]
MKQTIEADNLQPSSRPGALTIDLSGKNVLVTGGSRGIGRAIAICLAGCGANVAIVYRRADRESSEVVQTIESMGCKALSIKCDAAVHEEAAAAVAQVITCFGSLDILVNNVAISNNVPFLSITPEVWNRAVSVNVNSLYNFSWPALHHMMEKRYGRILNVGSICGVRPIAAVPVHYAATKGAMHAFTFTLAKEMARYNILINSIAPGLVETNFAMGLPEPRLRDFEKFCPMKRVGSPEEIANLAAFMVSDLNTYMTGETVVVGGGL